MTGPRFLVEYEGKLFLTEGAVEVDSEEDAMAFARTGPPDQQIVDMTGRLTQSSDLNLARTEPPA